MRVIFFLVFGLLFLASSGLAADRDFEKECRETYIKSGDCPKEMCRLKCWNGKEQKGCQQICLPTPCPEIPAEECPKEYCTVMTDCAERKICHFPMRGEKAKCGDQAYSGQDVPCCEGFVKRCGVEFFDGSCDMEGRNSVYNLPICIPCGDGICGNFENRCNCPEDCRNPTLDNNEAKGPAAKSNIE